MKNTPFTQKHIELGAKMAEFAGYNMPISYTGINDEHAAVRKNAGVFDVSHMGEFIIKGEHALDLIQRTTSNDASKLKAGQAQYSCLPNENGGIVDDLLVYCIEENKVYMLVVNASNIEKDWNWISQFNSRNAEMHDISDKTCLLAIQGPNATKILQALTEMDILNLKYYTFVKGTFAGVSNVVISATGYTGAGGVEIYFEDAGDNAEKIWTAIFEAGKTAGIKPVGRTISAHMKNTPFTQKHIELGAKMAEFAGYNMPISYTGINDEHAAVRKNAGVFDVSHMGEFIIKGEHALDLIQRTTSNDASKLKAGQAQYSCLPNENGGIVDDLLVYCIEENKVYMLVVNASNIEKDWNWISQFNSRNAEMHDISDKTCLLAIQGPNATKILQALTEMDILNLKYYTFVKGTFAGVSNVVISATGYTGAGGVEIYFEDAGDNAEKIWTAIFEAGKTVGIKPVGLGARDTLRLEMGYCLYGNDIDDTTSPLEAGLGWITKFAKDFTARPILEKQKAAGVGRKLVGFEMLEKGIPRHGYEIKDFSGELIGHVTSGTQSPSLGKAIGMGYVTTAFANPDTNIYIKVRDKLLQAKVVRMPFN